MVMKTYLKTLARMFRRHLTRLLSLIFMVLVSVGFISGIGSVTDKIDYSLSDYYEDRNVSDFIVKSTSADGFSEEEIESVEALFPGASVDTGMSVDLQVGDDGSKRSVRLYFLDFDNWTVNVPELVAGSAPSSETQIYAERADNVIEGYSVGDAIELDFKEILLKLSEQNGTELDESTRAMLDLLEPVTVTVSGVVQSPLTFARDGEPSYNNEGAAVPDDTQATKDMDVLENILYISKDLIPTYRDIMSALPDTPLIGTGDVYVAIADRGLFRAFSSGYEDFVEEQKNAITSTLPASEVITLYENYSFKSLNSYAGKVAGIGYILMIGVLLVTVLVVLSTMTRLLDEERSQIACLKTLGYSSAGIVSKYMLFALISTGIGGFGAYFVGMGIARLLYSVFDYSFAMPPLSPHITVLFYILTLSVIVAATLAATAISGLKMANEAPATLLRPKPPRSGKKVIIERIPLLWNRLSFKYKSTARNVLRYKNRFVMTVVSVAFATALVIAGLGLLDMCLFHDFGSEAILGVALVVVAFAGLLTAVVIYTLTNINISERNREIATLMVLGYYDNEVALYIYREVYINSVIGIILGYPVSLLLLRLLFGIMGFGSIGGVSWFMWLIAPVVVLLFTGLVTLLLRHKIVNIDMNESLKAIE